MISEIPGVRVGHWTDPAARTGCTVVSCPSAPLPQARSGGGAGHSRVGAAPTRADRGDRPCRGAHRGLGVRAGGVRRRDALVRGARPRISHPVGVRSRSWWAWCSTTWASAIRRVRPGPEQGYAACVAARPAAEAVQSGPVGAGSGATVRQVGRARRRPARRSRQRGGAPRRPGGGGPAGGQRGRRAAARSAFPWRSPHPGPPPVQPASGGGRARDGGGGRGRRARRRRPVDPTSCRPPPSGSSSPTPQVDKVGCLRLAQSGHDGLARALDPGAHRRETGMRWWRPLPARWRRRWRRCGPWPPGWSRQAVLDAVPRPRGRCDGTIRAELGPPGVQRPPVGPAGLSDCHIDIGVHQNRPASERPGGSPCRIATAARYNRALIASLEAWLVREGTVRAWTHRRQEEGTAPPATSVTGHVFFDGPRPTRAPPPAGPTDQRDVPGGTG